MALMVALGAASDDAGACVFHQTDFMGGVTLSSFRFGEPAAASSDAHIMETI